MKNVAKKKKKVFNLKKVMSTLVLIPNPNSNPNPHPKFGPYTKPEPEPDRSLSPNSNPKPNYNLILTLARTLLKSYSRLRQYLLTIANPSPN